MLLCRHFVFPSNTRAPDTQTQIVLEFLKTQKFTLCLHSFTQIKMGIVAHCGVLPKH